MVTARRTLGYTLALLVGLLALVAVLINVISQIPHVDRFVTSDRYLHLNITLVVALALLMLLLVSTLVYIGIDDRRRHQPLSTLYVPMVLPPLSWLVILGLAALSGLDRERHGLHTPLTQTWLRTPAVQVMIGLLLYAKLFLSSGWLLGVVLRGRGMSTRWVWLGTIALIALAVGIVQVTILLGS